MNRKLISFLLVLTLLFSTITATAQTTNKMENIRESLSRTTSSEIKIALRKFSDAENHWAKDSIGKLTHLGIIGGYPDGTFKPNQNIKVDEFIKLTVTAMGLKPTTSSAYWAEPYILLAKANHLIGDHAFADYKRPITRQEMAKIIVNAVVTTGEEAPDAHQLALMTSQVRDHLSITDPHRDAVLTAYTMGVIGGYPDKTFKPFNNSTRGEASTVIVRFLDPSMRKAVEPDMERVIVLPDYYGNNYVITPYGNQEGFDMTKAMLEAMEKSKGYGEKIYNPRNAYANIAVYENEEAYDEQMIDIFAANTQMSISVDTDLIEGYIGKVIVFDPDATKELHYDILVELFKSYFEKDYQKALVELEKVFNMTVPVGEKYIKTFTFNNRLIRFNKFGNDSGFQFFFSTKGYKP